MSGVGEHLNEFVVNNRKIAIQEEKFFVSTNGLLVNSSIMGGVT